jgi:hypothetical protein
MYRLNVKTGQISRLTFDQDSNWCPTMMENGRVMYLRWEYSDQAHMFSRILMTMNPDGTGQVAHYGSNSYWPNGAFDAKPIPGQSSKFIAVITGHHVPRQGTLCLFDTSKGRTENKGVITEIPDAGIKQTQIVRDHLYGGRWPKCLNPFPLGTSANTGAGKFFVVSAQLARNTRWGIYLVDVFGNFTLIKDMDGNSLNEPIPFIATKRPPVLPDRIVPGAKEASVYIQNIYEGPGLKNVPKGSEKNLRLFSYHFAFGKVGSHDAIGIESSWDVKRVMGTVPVEKDGSAAFKIPANTPIAIQPLDDEGRALQLMRSWFIGMPGETVSCVGCHESQNMPPPVYNSLAFKKPPQTIKTWYGQTRGFSFGREVQPVLDRKCIGCHNGAARRDKKKIPNFDDVTQAPVPYENSKGKINGGPFPKSYIALSAFVRRPGPESDMHLLEPMEYHASTSRLMQMLDAGHHGVELTAEERDRLHTWIDLNVPCYGTYTEAQRNWLNPDY